MEKPNSPQNLKVQEHIFKEFIELCEKFEQANKPIRDCPTKTNPAGTRNASAKTATTTTEKRNSIVSCIAGILPTAPTIFEPLSSKLKIAKMVAVATGRQAQQQEKGIQSKQGRGPRACNFQKT